MPLELIRTPSLAERTTLGLGGTAEVRLSCASPRTSTRWASS